MNIPLRSDSKLRLNVSAAFVKATALIPLVFLLGNTTKSKFLEPAKPVTGCLSLLWNIVDYFVLRVWDPLEEIDLVTWNSVDVLKPAPFVLWGQILPAMLPPSVHSIWRQSDTIKKRYISKSIASYFFSKTHFPSLSGIHIEKRAWWWISKSQNCKMKL